MAPSKDKENAGLQQSSITSLMNKKRSLMLANGDELDITSSNLPVSKEIVEALRLRILELEDSAAGQPPAKKARISTTSDAEPGPSRTAAAADAKKVNAMIKKIWDRLAKEVKGEAYKFKGGNPKTVRFEEVLQEEEFASMFKGKGHLIQPTPTNKPNSTVTIIEFGSENSVRELFGKSFKELKGNQWTSSVGFQKSYKMGQCELMVNTLSVNYSKNGMKCTLKFEVEERNPQCIRGYGWFRDY